MEGLRQLRRRKGCLWPSPWDWLWAFEPEAALCKEFGMFVQGEEVGHKREFAESNPCDKAYKVCDPASSEYSELLRGGKGALRRSSRTPSPARVFVPTLGGEPTPNPGASELEKSYEEMKDPLPSKVKTPPVMVRIEVEFLMWSTGNAWECVV